MKANTKVLGALVAATAVIAAACTGGAGSPSPTASAGAPSAGASASAAPTPTAPNDHILRIAMGSPGEAQIRVWDDVGKQFEAANPDTKVELNYLDDDLYETIGLQNLLTGRNAPDIYFEWTGSRLAQKVTDGFAADITDAFASGPLAGLFDDAVLNQYKIDGKVVMVPYSADVTNVLWYNKKILGDAGVQPPKTWDELLAACDKLNTAGVIPIASGNKDVWPAGNWLAHMTSRVVGEDAYIKVLGGSGKFDTPEWETAFGYISALADHKCVNQSANAIDDNEGAQLFFQGKAAMHPIGSWLVSWAIDEAPDLEFDYVNLPAMPGGAGNQDSVIGVATGYAINAKTVKMTEATKFMALLNSEANVKALLEAEVTPLTKSASAGQNIDSRTSRLSALLNGAPVIVLPPDTGYDLKMADALYKAIAAVLGKQKTPAEALAGIDTTLGR